MPFSHRHSWLTLLLFVGCLAEPASAMPPVAAAVNPAVVPTAPLTEIRLPLLEGNRISGNALHEQLNARWGTNFELPNQDYELTGLVWFGLKVLDQNSDLFSIEKNAGELIVRLANPESSKTRRDLRLLLGKLTGRDFLAWPADKKLHLPTPFDPQRHTIVLLHGFNSDAQDIRNLHHELSKRGYQVAHFDYPNQGPIAWSGEKLRAELAALHKTQQPQRISLIGHSMGGLVARSALESEPALPANVTDLITLGTPHAGSELAELAPWLVTLSVVNAQRFPWPDPTRNGLGEAGWDLRPTSLFFKELNARERPKTVRYHTAIGTRSFRDDPERAKLLDQAIQQMKALPRQTAALQRWVQLLESDALQSGQGDGVVTRESAQLTGVTPQEFPCDHCQLISLDKAGKSDMAIVDWIEKILGKPE